MNPMKHWMRAATAQQQADLAQRAGTSRQYLYHLAGGFRDASPELAARIERAALAMRRERGGRGLPELYRTDLNTACRDCEYAQRCLKGRAVVSEFDYVDVAEGAIDAPSV